MVITVVDGARSTAIKHEIKEARQKQICDGKFYWFYYSHQQRNKPVSSNLPRRSSW
jgi:hypothetical protein